MEGREAKLLDWLSLQKHDSLFVRTKTHPQRTPAQKKPPAPASLSDKASKGLEADQSSEAALSNHGAASAT
jgi:hypothetical protein